MSIANKILKIRDHSLNIDSLWIDNIETDDNTTDLPDDKTVKGSETAGDIEPIIDVNGYRFHRDDIKHFELDETTTIPEINVTVKDSTGKFTNNYYPKSKCLLKLYIKSPNPNLRAIRCDFLMTDITPSDSSSSNAGMMGMGYTYSISGVLNIPKMYQNSINSYNETSYDALLDIAKKLDIGFATNEISTNDKMCWYQPNINYEQMINDISLHAYKDDKSFFKTFIDIYYNLTFLNMANMTAEGDTDDVDFSSMSYMKDYITRGSLPTQDKSESSPTRLILSNFIGFKGSSTFIRSFSIKSEQGSHLMYAPSTKNVYYYDIQQSRVNQEKFVHYYVKPLTDSITSDDEISKNYTNVWEGIESGNVHDNFIFSKNNNIQNLNDITKTTLNLKIEGVNLNILRGMRIPIMIFKTAAISQTSQLQNSELGDKEMEMSKDDNEVIPDVHLTSYYVVDGIKIIYNQSARGTNNAFSTELTCVRNNWTKNDKIKKIDE